MTCSNYTPNDSWTGTKGLTYAFAVTVQKTESIHRATIGKLPVIFARVGVPSAAAPIIQVRSEGDEAAVPLQVGAAAFECRVPRPYLRPVVIVGRNCRFNSLL
jgi:hypothetical protein